MREKTIRKLVKLVEQADIASLTVRSWWTTVQIVKRNEKNGNGHTIAAGEITIPREAVKPTLPPIVAAAPEAPAPAPNPAPQVQPSAVTRKEITSPMVGTFYVAPEPGAPPFAEIGSRVRKGQTLCLIEAMKLMNEIEAEYDCVVSERLVENALPVEFGQPIFRVEPL